MKSEYKFQPHDGKQIEFLQSKADWVFYGGARGGGKALHWLGKPLLRPESGIICIMGEE